jgi:hypothetical protein
MAKDIKPAEESRTYEALLAENNALKAQLAAAQAEKEKQAEVEKKILAKTALGLGRDQAIAVIKRQEEFDAAKVAKPAKAKQK